MGIPEHCSSVGALQRDLADQEVEGYYWATEHGGLNHLTRFEGAPYSNCVKEAK